MFLLQRGTLFSLSVCLARWRAPAAGTAETDTVPARGVCFLIARGDPCGRQVDNGELAMQGTESHATASSQAAHRWTFHLSDSICAASGGCNNLCAKIRQCHQRCNVTAADFAFARACALRSLNCSCRTILRTLVKRLRAKNEAEDATIDAEAKCILALSSHSRADSFRKIFV